MSNIANVLADSIARPGYLVDADSGLPYLNADGIVLLTSAAVTANNHTDILTNYTARGVKLYANVGAQGSGASAITVKIQAFDPVNSLFFDLLTSASLTASTPVVLTIYPGITATSNVSVSDVLPRSWRVTWQATAWGAGGSTLGIAAALLL